MAEIYLAARMFLGYGKIHRVGSRAKATKVGYANGNEKPATFIFAEYKK